MLKLKISLTNLVFVFCFLNTLNGTAQEHSKTDNELILKIKTSKPEVKKRVRTYVFKNQKSILKKYNPISLGFGGLLYFYQNALSPQFSADCLFHPTCSDFSKRAIREYGLLKGVFLSTDRVTRCNRIAATSIHMLKVDEHTHHAHDEVELYKFKK